MKESKHHARRNIKLTPDKAHCVQHLQDINKDDEWGTDWEDFSHGCYFAKFKPTLDVCATDENALLENYFTKKQNGLIQEWKEDFWMNPPYSEVKEWMAKATEQVRKHNVNGLILVYAKTDTKWWHEFVEKKAEVHFIKGRLKFIDSDGEQSKNSAPYPSCFIILRSKENVDKLDKILDENPNISDEEFFKKSQNITTEYSKGEDKK